MLVREVMTAEPVTVRADTHAKEALRLLDEHSITMLPVVFGDTRVVGVVSEADLIRGRVLPDVRSSLLPPDTSATDEAVGSVGEVMSRRVLTVRESSDVAEAAELMTSTGVKSLPVLDAEDHLVGVVSRRDIVHVLARSDLHVERDLDALFESLGVTWLASSDEGSVTITGPVAAKERSLARAAASTVPGVVRVTFG